MRFSLHNLRGKITVGPVEIELSGLKKANLDELKAKRDKLLEELKQIEDEIKKQEE